MCYFKFTHSNSYLTANDIHVPTARDKLWLLPVPQLFVCEDVFEQQYTSCMKVGSGGNLDLRRKYYLGLCFNHGGIVLGHI